MALYFPDTIESNNPQEYGIIKADQVAGSKRVSTLSDLYKIPDTILSATNNTDNDAIGLEWYVTELNKYYALTNWELRHSDVGWTPRKIGSSGVGQSIPEGGEIFNVYEGSQKNVSTGLYSHAEGVGCQSIGEGSHAEGGYTLALQDYAHAEGLGTKATGDYSHAEGLSTTAEGNNSHAEGSYTLASGLESHAEGGGVIEDFGWKTKTIASGSHSHAEGGGTTAAGDDSHAEGNHSKALAMFSHAEGYNTVASNVSQHVQGQYNTQETEESSLFDLKRSLFKIGNGQLNQRSDALNMLGDGTIWIGGIGTFNGTNALTDNSLQAVISNLTSTIQTVKQDVDTLNQDILITLKDING